MTSFCSLVRVNNAQEGTSSTNMVAESAEEIEERFHGPANRSDFWVMNFPIYFFLHSGGKMIFEKCH